MSLVRRPLAALVALAGVAALMLLGPLSPPASAAAPLAGAPKVGECHQLTLKTLDKSSDHSRKVRCSRQHTSRVIRVAQLPDGVSWNAPVEKLGRIATRNCEPAWKKTLGGSFVSRDRSAYSWGWFIPTTAQRDRGARWISCHVLLWGGNRSLAPLPTDKVPALGSLPHPDKVAVCLAPRSFNTTVCARKHVYRGTGTFTMDKKQFPGDRAIRRAATNRCPAHVATADFRWSYRSKQRWEMGDHVVVCYSRTRR